MEGWGQARARRAHVEHKAHVRDAGRIEAQRLVEIPRGLPSRKEGMRDARRGAGRKAGGCVGQRRWTQAARTGRAEDSTGGLGRQGSGGERTPNMPAMVVTLDVLKLTGWLNLYAACRVERRACDHAGGEVRAGRCGS